MEMSSNPGLDLRAIERWGTRGASAQHNSARREPRNGPLAAAGHSNLDLDKQTSGARRQISPKWLPVPLFLYFCNQLPLTYPWDQAAASNAHVQRR